MNPLGRKIGNKLRLVSPKRKLFLRLWTNVASKSVLGSGRKNIPSQFYNTLIKSIAENNVVPFFSSYFYQPSARVKAEEQYTGA